MRHIADLKESHTGPNTDVLTSIFPDLCTRRSRDRNRKHARNTRLRKKAYIEELERTVQQLTAERDAAAAAKAAESARTAQLQSVRFSVLQMALFYRAAGNVCRADWATALEENFTCVLPITPYRSFPSAEVVSGQRMIMGIDAMMADVASLALMVESIGRCRPSERRVQVRVFSQIVARWSRVMPDNGFALVVESIGCCRPSERRVQVCAFSQTAA